MNKLFIRAGGIIIILVIGGIGLFLFRPETSQRATVSGANTLGNSANGAVVPETTPQDPQKELPSFVYNSALSLQAYKLALSQPEILSPMPCYCDCGRASGHKSLRDCFFKSGEELNDHASNCDVCQDEITDLHRWRTEGKSLREIRGLIDAKYRDFGEPTDTPFEAD